MICAKCGSSIPSGESVKYRSKNYHSSCLDALKAAARAKDHKKAAVSSVRLDPERDHLERYLCSLFEIPSITPLLNKQINDLHTQRGYSYHHIALSLRYFFNILPGNMPEPASPSIGIVPYIYDEALAFFALSDEANEYNKNLTIKDQSVVLPYQTKPSPVPNQFRMEDI